MEGIYGVYLGKQLSGKVQVTRQGLYYKFACRCQLTGDVVYRLEVTSGNSRENLGILVPMDGGFGLDTKVPVKRFQEGETGFQLLPKHEKSSGTFVAIYPEEPFAYISRLKSAFLVKQNGRMGILLQELGSR